MFNITDYIQEKLHLTKDYVSDDKYEFAKGDTIGTLIISDSNWYSVFMIGEPVTFLAKEGNNICYRKDYKTTSVNQYKNNVWRNSNGYYECKDGVDDKLTYILLNKEQTLEFINKFKSIKIETLIHEYIDKGDMHIKNININSNQLSIKELEKLYNEAA